jgi:hypothetical protein
MINVKGAPMTVAQFEKRLAVLETEVARLKSALLSKDLWWNKIAGVFANDPLFEQAMRNCRAASKRPIPGCKAKNAPSKNRGGPALVALAGTITYRPDYDYKKLRARKTK